MLLKVKKGSSILFFSLDNSELFRENCKTLSLFLKMGVIYYVNVVYI